MEATSHGPLDPLVAGRVRVVHLLQDIVASGLERMLYSSAKQWQEHQVSNVLVGQGPTMAYESELRDVGYDVRTIAPIKTVQGAMDFVNLLRAVNPDVVHIQTEQAFIVTPGLVKLAAPRTKIVRTFHAVFDATGNWGRKRKTTARVTSPLVSAFTAVSPYVASTEQKFGRECEIIANWVDPKYHLAARSKLPSQVAMALVGNCAGVKNHEVVLRSALEHQIPLHHLGSEASASQEELDLLTALDQAGLLLSRGVQDPLPVLREGPVYCLPSKDEGFSISLLEALAVGSFAIVTSSPSLDWASEFPTVSRADWTSHHDWSVQFENVVRARNEFGDEYSAAAQVLAVEKFSVEAGVQAYTTLYRRITGIC